ERPRPDRRLPLVRQRRRRQRRHHDDRAGCHRPARSERRGQVHAHPHDGGLPAAVRRHGRARRRPRLAQRGRLPPDRAGARAGGDVRRDERLAVRARQRPAAPPARPGGGGPPRDRDGADGRRAGARHRHLLQGDEAAHQDGHRPRARPPGPAPRRAVQRHGPAPAPAAHGPAARDGRAGPHRAVQLAHPRGGGADRDRRPGRRRRAARRLGRLPRDPAAHDRTAPPVHGPLRRRPRARGRGHGRRQRDGRRARHDGRGRRTRGRAGAARRGDRPRLVRPPAAPGGAAPRHPPLRGHARRRVARERLLLLGRAM
ncbi:MAG: Efflux ABC transporter, ATP-binding protein, partial [uncultured Frankineae bacterium]